MFELVQKLVKLNKEGREAIAALNELKDTPEAESVKKELDDVIAVLLDIFDND